MLITRVISERSPSHECTSRFLRYETRAKNNDRWTLFPHSSSGGEWHKQAPTCTDTGKKGCYYSIYKWACTPQTRSPPFPPTRPPPTTPPFTTQPIITAFLLDYKRPQHLSSYFLHIPFHSTSASFYYPDPLRKNDLVRIFSLPANVFLQLTSPPSAPCPARSTKLAKCKLCGLAFSAQIHFSFLHFWIFSSSYSFNSHRFLFFASFSHNKRHLNYHTTHTCVLCHCYPQMENAVIQIFFPLYLAQL